MRPKSRFSKPIFYHPAGSTKVHRPYCEQAQGKIQRNPFDPSRVQPEGSSKRPKSTKIDFLVGKTTPSSGKVHNGP